MQTTAAHSICCRSCCPRQCPPCFDGPVTGRGLRAALRPQLPPNSTTPRVGLANGRRAAMLCRARAAASDQHVCVAVGVHYAQGRATRLRGATQCACTISARALSQPAALTPGERVHQNGLPSGSLDSATALRTPCRCPTSKSTAALDCQHSAPCCRWDVARACGVCSAGLSHGAGGRATSSSAMRSYPAAFLTVQGRSCTRPRLQSSSASGSDCCGTIPARASRRIWPRQTALARRSTDRHLRSAARTYECLMNTARATVAACTATQERGSPTGLPATAACARACSQRPFTTARWQSMRCARWSSAQPE